MSTSFSPIHAFFFTKLRIGVYHPESLANARAAKKLGADPRDANRIGCQDDDFAAGGCVCGNFWENARTA
jgi:hypothetical protein